MKAVPVLVTKITFTSQFVAWKRSYHRQLIFYFRIGTSKGCKWIRSHAQTMRFWYLLGVLSKISDEHPRHFHMGVPPPPPGLSDRAIRKEGCKMMEVAYQKLAGKEDLKMKWVECCSEEDAEERKVRKLIYSKTFSEFNIAQKTSLPTIFLTIIYRSSLILSTSRLLNATYTWGQPNTFGTSEDTISWRRAQSCENEYCSVRKRTWRSPTASPFK